MKLYFLGCDVLYREACYLAATSPHTLRVEFLRKGLHDLQTPDMLAHIQNAVDAASAEEGWDAILLGYARCNDGLVGLTARSCPLVIPKAHDCITLYFGSRRAYREYFDEHPGTYYETTGWLERADQPGAELDRPAYDMPGVMAALGLTESYDELVAKHGKDNAEYIIESLGGWENAYSRLCYLEMGVCREDEFIETARARAAEKGWTFDRRKGSLHLLRKLFWAQWDEDFVVVRPGEQITARNDEEVLGKKDA